MAAELVLGAVAYDPKVVTIWDGFRVWLREQGVPFDYVLFAQYERQVEHLLDGGIDVAWNSPLAWVRARRLAAARGVPLRPVVMRDSDRDLRTVVVVADGSPVRSLGGLAGATVATGALDSPQATLLPLSLLRCAGLVPGRDVTVRRFDIGVGLHGDHIGGERDAARALARREVDAACLVDANLLLFGREGVLPPGSVRVIAQTEPYDHCTMTAGPSAEPGLLERFGDLLLGMSYADPLLRPLLDLEGLTQWLPARPDRYALLEQAVDEAEFYDPRGDVIARDYRP